MQHYVKMKVDRPGYRTWRLLDDQAKFVSPFDAFIETMVNQGYSQNTINRYSDVVATFLDYLTEAGVYGKPASRRDINDAVDRYLNIRLNADSYRENAERGATDATKWELLVQRLSIRQLSPSSLANTKAALNLFLAISAERHQLEIEDARFRGMTVSTDDSPSELFRTQRLLLTSPEMTALLKGSMLASATRHGPSGIFRGKGAMTHRKCNPTQALDEDAMDFPIEKLGQLFDAATSYRDKAYWLLMAAGGLRSHEADQVPWSDIDVETRQVFIKDPGNLRFSKQIPDNYKLRFKGREVSQTYLIQPLRDQFFEALEAYVRFEWVPGVEHDFVFQDIRSGQAGRPFFLISHAAKTKSFNEACRQIDVPRKPSGRRYGRHSLRHFYGLFLLNYLPLPDGFGLRIDEVQRLMGHKNRKSTEKYARQDKLILISKLEFADNMLLSRSTDLHDLPLLIAERYEADAQKIRKDVAND